MLKKAVQEKSHSLELHLLINPQNVQVGKLLLNTGTLGKCVTVSCISKKDFAFPTRKLRQGLVGPSPG